MYNQIIYSILSSATAITDIVGAANPRIYPVILGQTATLPAITYVKEIHPTNTKGLNTVQDMVHVYFMSIAYDVDTADALANAIRTAIDNRAYTDDDYHIPIMQLVKQGEEIYINDEGTDVIMIPQHFTIKANKK